MGGSLCGSGMEAVFSGDSSLVFGLSVLDCAKVSPGPAAARHNTALARNMKSDTLCLCMNRSPVFPL